MSYILDALRKSEQQRRQANAPFLPSVAAAPTSGRPAFLTYALLGLLLMAVGMAIGWFRPWRHEPAATIPPPPTVLNLLESPQGKTAPTALAEAPAKTVLSEPSPLERPALAPLPTAGNGTARKSWPAPGRSEAHNKRPAGITAKAKWVDMPPEKEAWKSSSESAVEQLPVQSAEPQLSTQQKLPPMAIAVHAYSSTPRERLVSINGRMLREGDALAPDLRLEQITPDGMIFAYRGHRIRRGVQ